MNVKRSIAAALVVCAMVAGMANVDRADGYERLAQPQRRIVGLDDPPDSLRVVMVPLVRLERTLR